MCFSFVFFATERARPEAASSPPWVTPVGLSFSCLRRADEAVPLARASCWTRPSPFVASSGGLDRALACSLAPSLALSVLWCPFGVTRLSVSWASRRCYESVRGFLFWGIPGKRTVWLHSVLESVARVEAGDASGWLK